MEGSFLSMHADNVGDDCPVFDGLFDYCSISAGGSMGERVAQTQLFSLKAEQWGVKREPRD